jgi:predicted DNA-binding transcriptional regulator YafY
MSDIQTTEEPRIPCKELTGKALNDHANQLFQMYSGDTLAVKMRFHNSLSTVVIDRFGADQMYIPDGPDHFVFTVNIAISPMFLSWIIGFGTNAKILYPASAIEECRKMCLDVAAQYAANE